MNFIIIKGNERLKKENHKLSFLRKNHQVPCIIYNALTNIQFYTHKNNFKKILYKNEFFPILIELNNKKIKTILYDIQFHPVSDEILHADFYKFSNKHIILNIPIKIIGRSIGVSKGGEYNFPLKKLKIKSLPINIPSTIDININNLEIGDCISVENIKSNKYEILHPKNTIIVAIRTSRVSIKTEQELEKEEKKNK